MARKYNLSPEGKAALVKTAERARTGLDAPDRLIARIERAKSRLTPEHIARLSALLASAPSTADKDS
ncbi:hypothetical protein [Streptomyces olivochromogenes]|uniref:hypothetical protein n=1 Tax=Streptomyces olivochromogenes TaxID=1963 RepID=UPI0036945664